MKNGCCSLIVGSTTLFDIILEVSFLFLSKFISLGDETPLLSYFLKLRLYGPLKHCPYIISETMVKKFISIGNFKLCFTLA